MRWSGPRPCISRCPVLVSLLVASIAAGTLKGEESGSQQAGASGASDSAAVVVVQPDGERRFSANSIAGLSFRILNQTRNSLDLDWRLDIDSEWDPLVAVGGSGRLEGGAEMVVPVLASIPQDAAAGPGRIGLTVFDRSGRQLARGEAHYIVETSGRLAFGPSDVQPLAWGPYTSRTWLSNRSNVAVEVELEAASSMQWSTKLSADVVQLPPLGGAWVEVAVKPPRIRAARVNNTITVRGRTNDLPAARREVIGRVTATVLSRTGSSEQPVLRGWLEFESMSTRQDRSASLNLAIAGALDQRRRLDLRLGESLPVGSEDILSRRASYLRLDDSRLGGLLIGRTSQSFTRLTAYPQWGEWVRARRSFGRADVSLFSSVGDSETVIGSVRGGSVTFGPPGGKGHGLTFFEAEKSPTRPETGFTMTTAWVRHNWAKAHLEGELAVGRHDDGTRGLGFRFASNGTRGRWDWDSEVESASEHFPGTSWNLDQAWGSVGFAASRDLRVWIGGMRQRSVDLELPPAADVRRAEAGVTWRGAERVSLAISQAKTDFAPTSSQLERRSDELSRLRADLGLSEELTASVVVDVGTRTEGLRRESVTRPSYRLRYRPNDRWFVRGEVQPEIDVQEIFDFRQRWNVFARWQAEKGSWIDITGQQLDCGPLATTSCADEPALRISVGRNLGGFRSKWKVIGFAHRRGDDDVTAGLRIRRGLAFNSPLGRSRPNVLGQVIVPEGLPIPVGVEVNLGGRSGRVDAQGRFRIRGLEPGAHAMSIDQRSLGVSLIAVPQPAVSVSPEEQEAVEVSLRLFKPGSIEGSVLSTPGASVGRAVTGATQPLGGLTVYFEHRQWPDRRHIAVTGSDGSFMISGMTPGRWTVRLGKHEIPRGIEAPAHGAALEVELSEGQAVVLDPIKLKHRVQSQSLRTVTPLVLEGSLWGSPDLD